MTTSSVGERGILGHDVIDLTFLEHAGTWYRFSANAHARERTPELGHHVFEERGPALDEPEFEPFVVEIGKRAMRRAEGPGSGDVCSTRSGPRERSTVHERKP